MNTTIWDVIVVGGGPAGMMVAGTAAQRGKTVLLIEKNDTLGKKLLITGGGRCNVTNSQFDTRAFLAKFKDADKFLFSAFSQYSVAETLDFFHTHGMETKVENELRTFPVSNSAQSVWDVLVNYMKENSAGKGGVTILSNSKVTEIVREDKSTLKGTLVPGGRNKIVGVKLSNNKTILGKNIVIATGGTSRPETGSTGDAYAWLKDLGHTVIMPEPSLVPIAIKDSWVKKLAGTSLPDVKITVLQNNQKQQTAKGKILFTHVGVSGPTILNMSKDIGELLKYDEVTLSLDILPSEDYGTLNTKLQELFKEHDKKKLRNALAEMIPTALVPIIVELAQVDGEIPCNSVTREQRIKLIEVLKNIPMQVEKLLGEEKAIITSGGVELSEIDFKTMRSRLYPNLYVVGDMLNIDRPSGGYSLQLCWTTGWVAGSNCE